MRIGPRCNRSKTESLTSLSTHEAGGLVHCGVGRTGAGSQCAYGVSSERRMRAFLRTIEAAGLV